MCTGRENGRSRMKNRKKKNERERQGDSKRLEQLKTVREKTKAKGAEMETGRQGERNGAKRDRDRQSWGETETHGQTEIGRRQRRVVERG